jgi:hypothetical protein
MAKIYKTEMYIVDVNDSFKSMIDICSKISERLDLIFINPFNTQMREIEWDDNIDLNFNNCTLESYRKYFELD